MNLWVSIGANGLSGLVFFLNHVLSSLLGLLYVVVFDVLTQRKKTS